MPHCDWFADRDVVKTILWSWTEWLKIRLYIYWKNGEKMRQDHVTLLECRSRAIVNPTTMKIYRRILITRHEIEEEKIFRFSICFRVIRFDCGILIRKCQFCFQNCAWIEAVIYTILITQSIWIWRNWRRYRNPDEHKDIVWKYISYTCKDIRTINIW